MQLRKLIAACTAIMVFGFALGVTYPLLSLLLEADGVSTDMIGINAAMSPIGILLFSPAIPFFSKRFGSRQTAIAAVVVTSALLLGFKVFDSLEAWFIVRLLLGMAIATLFVLSEAWVVQYAGNQHRGKVVAIYGAILAASFGIGPAIVSWVGIEGWTPFVIGSTVILLSVIPLSMLREETAPEVEEASTGSLFEFAAKAPALLTAVATFAIFDAATLSLIPVYGLQTGLELSTAALALSALIAGNVVLQFPVGWLADRIPKRHVLIACAGLTILFACLLPMTMNSPWMWPTLILLGATAYGIYTVSLAELGDRFQGHELVSGSSAFAVMWGMGALFGSVSGGWAMSHFGPHGLPLFLALCYTALLAVVIVRTTTAKASQNSG